MFLLALVRVRSKIPKVFQILLYSTQDSFVGSSYRCAFISMYVLLMFFGSVEAKIEPDSHAST